MPGHTRDQELEEELDFHQYKPNVIFLGKLKSSEKNYFDSVHLCNFADNSQIMMKMLLYLNLN